LSQNILSHTSTGMNTQATELSTPDLMESEVSHKPLQFSQDSASNVDDISIASNHNIEGMLNSLKLESNNTQCTHGADCTQCDNAKNDNSDHSAPNTVLVVENSESKYEVIQGNIHRNDISNLLKNGPSESDDKLNLDDNRSRSTSDLIWEKPVNQFQQIFLNNKRWVQTCLQEDPEFFSKLAVGQNPQFLCIGCSDSRVPAQEIMGMKAGELFLHRNIANLVVNSDINLLSVLDYSINFLDIKDIIVLGHYGCGGVQAALTKQDHGLVSHWLRNIRDVHRLHQDELLAIRDEKKRLQRMVELNVMEQCINLFGNSIVQKAQSLKGYPRIHGMVYDISNGYLRELDIDFRPLLKKYRDIYSVYSFRKKTEV